MLDVNLYWKSRYRKPQWFWIDFIAWRYVISVVSNKKLMLYSTHGITVESECADQCNETKLLKMIRCITILYEYICIRFMYWLEVNVM